MLCGMSLLSSYKPFRLGVMKRFFTKRVVRHGDWLPRAVVTAPSLLQEALEQASQTHGLILRVFVWGGPRSWTQ